MASRLLLWVWPSLLLQSSTVFSAPKGGDYRQAAASTYLVEADDDSSSLSFDEGEMVTSNSIDYPNDNKPSVTKPLNFLPTGKNQPSMPGVPDVERTVNAGARDWESNLFDPRTFSQNPSNKNVDGTKQKRVPAWPQSTPQPLGSPIGSISVSPNSVVSGHAMRVVPYQPAQMTSLSTVSSESSKPATTDSDVLVTSAFDPLHQFNSGSSSTVHSVFRKGSPPGSVDAGHSPVAKELVLYAPTVRKLLGPYYEERTKLPQNFASLTTGRYDQSNMAEPSTWSTSLPLKHSVKYPSVTPQHYTSAPVSVGSSTFYTFASKLPQSTVDWMDFLPFDGFDAWNLHFLDGAPFDHNMGTRLQGVGFPQGANLKTHPRSSRLKLTTQSKSGYKRQRIVQSKASISPE